MADQATSLPIRSEADGTDERVQTKIVDATNPDTQQMEVDSDNNAHVEVHGNNPAGGDETLRMSELGHTSVDGEYDGTNNTDPSNIGILAHSRNASPADTQQTERLTSIEDSGGTVRALDISLHDESGEAYSGTNPLPVTIDNPGGCEESYKTAAAVAKDATDTHTFSPSAASALKQITASASGKIRVEIKAGVAASETTRMVFFNSTSNPNIIWTPGCGFAIDAAHNVLVEITNLDNQAMDVYSRIEVQND